MKKILVLGGTRFFGKKLVQFLLDEGAEVTIATRGNTKDTFGDRVSRIIIDRQNLESLKKAAHADQWDVVYDNICYSPNEAKEACGAFINRVKRYIFTSTLSVYEFGDRKKEEDFNPYKYPIKMGSRDDFSYGEAKRLAEAVFFQEAEFPVCAPRFPIVLGLDDYTKRLHFHVDSVKNETEIGLPNREALLSFINSDEAARFLAWLGNNEVTGPINACSKGELTLNQIINVIESEVGKEAIIKQTAKEENMSPFGVTDSWYMDQAKAVHIGFEFEDINRWFPKLVKELA